MIVIVIPHLDQITCVIKLQQCGCVAFYMPRNPDTTPICSPEKVDCVHEAVVKVEETAFIDAYTTETNCQCLPSCTHIEYPHEYSAVHLKSDLLHIPEDLEGNVALLNKGWVA